MDIVLKRFLPNLFALLLQRITVISSYPQYQEVIPNGEGLPHPCKPNYIWHGVGHLNDRGGGKLNDFGKAFNRLGKKWSKSLCQLDSDGDGKTNGEELGDPDCIWVPGASPKRRNGITHPGVCDPFDDNKCKAKNEWVDCDLDELKCQATKSVDVMNVTLRMEDTKVPGMETTYMCTMFDLPTDEDYHMIANTPYIDNEYVMHHMLLYGCPETAQINKMPANKTNLCTFGNHGCTEIIGLWTIGSSGVCSPKEFGVRMGPKGYKRAVLQVHWHNPELKTDYSDSSGLTLYYTRTLRPNDAAIMSVGNVNFDLPPGRPEVKVVGTCTKKCSKQKFEQPFFISSAINHMHYLGIKQRTEVIRDGVQINVIADEDDYNYDSPKVHSFHDPVEIKPGDEIKTTCVYKTTSRVNNTHFGLGTNDEMCFIFLTFYPTQNVKKTECAQYGSLSYCELGEPILHECHVKNFRNTSYPEFADMRRTVKEHCMNSTCSDECKRNLDIIRFHPCMKGDVGDLLRLRLHRDGNNDAKEFYNVLKSCPSKLRDVESSSSDVTSYIHVNVLTSVFLVFFLNIHINHI